ncbi:MAG: hypothetical protein Tsb005_15310 [Gammaproteobacteria bacterium]
MAEQSSDFDEEYQFTDSETADPYTSAVTNASTSNRSKLAGRRRLIIVVAVIVLGFAAVKIYQFFTSDKADVPAKVKASQQAKKPASQTELPTFPAPTAQTSPAPVAAPVTDTPPAPVASSSQIQQLNSEITDVKSQLNDLQSTVSSLNYLLQNMSKKIEQQQSALAQQETLLLKLQPKPKPTPTASKESLKKQQVYYLEAAVPGRAWLRSNQGHSLTVGRGDRIPGYQGVVLHIDPQVGEVVLSSGKVLRYSPSDS